jgi:hypothetical protein
MGHDWRPGKAVSPCLVKVLFFLLDDKIANAEDADDVSQPLGDCKGFVICLLLYIFSKGLFLSDLKGIQDEYTAGCSHNPSYSTLALFGQVKVEQHHYQHLMYSMDVTSSGIQVRKVILDLVLDLILIRQHQGHLNGPTICDKEGIQWTAASVNKIMHKLFCSLYDQDPPLFPSHIGLHGDILMKYHVYHVSNEVNEKHFFMLKSISTVFVVHVLYFRNLTLRGNLS